MQTKVDDKQVNTPSLKEFRDTFADTVPPFFYEKAKLTKVCDY